MITASQLGAHRLPSDRPSVTVSYAQTLDGRLATRGGSSQWISGSESLRFAHELRATHDAIMVGVGTVLRDDPRLTVRLVELAPGPARPQPLRVIVDSACRTPPAARVLAGGAAPGTLLAATASADPARIAAVRGLGAEVLVLGATEQGQVDLARLLRLLRVRGVGTLLVEGGARLITSLLRGHLVDRLAVTIAPKILGAGIEAIGDLGIDDLAHALQLREPSLTAYGSDIVLDGRVSYPARGEGG